MLELAVTGVGSDGAGVARDADGRAVFVPGALPGEVVTATIEHEHKRHAVARLVAVVEASPDRVEVDCEAVARGCGGCDLRHVDHAGELALKERIVADALERIGRIVDAPAVTTMALDPDGYRTTARCVVTDGQAGYRHRRSHDALVVTQCPVLHPELETMVVDGIFDGVREVTLRMGAATGERVVIADPHAAGVDVTLEATVVGTDELKAGRRVWYHEMVGERRWRISARSFFQARPDGAAALVDAVAEAVPDRTGHLVDLYGGVGLFAGSLGWAGPITLVERSGAAVADARVNLADLDVKIVATPVERWRPGSADVVVADPARAGLGKTGVARAVGTGAGTIVLVSCDAGSLGRDAGLLVAAGYRLDTVTLVDVFSRTSRVEVVSRFTHL